MRQRAGWREYQRHLRRERRLRATRRMVVHVLPLALVLGLTVLAIWQLAGRMAQDPGGVPAALACSEGGLSKPELAGLLGHRLVDADKPGLLTVAAGEVALYGQTTIDADLQRYVSELLAASGALQGACVVLEPDSGRILALASHNPGGDENLCLAASPAASIFKLVTAAAAIEEKRLAASSRLHYNGDPYRMARRNLRKKPNRYSARITLARAFAQSINPVFGQLGAFEVGAEGLRAYGERFCFNRAIPFELLLASSRLEVPEDDFQVARIAAGYNRTTTISPVHAALLAAAVVTGGRMVEPRILERVVDAQLKPVYTPRSTTLERLFSERTAHQMRRLMRATVSGGTCRRSMLRELGRQRLEKIEVGGKTGSIFARGGEMRYDWFAGYGLRKGGGKRVALAVLQVHGDYLGQKSPRLAARIIRHYLEPADGVVTAAARGGKRRKGVGES